MADQVRISIIICTYNRYELLAECLQSLRQQGGNKSHFEVIVVNNNSTDATLATAYSFESYFPHFQVLTETVQGLSFARNRGLREATAPWVFYLDDDAKAASDLVQRALQIIEAGNYQFFGGVYLPWYKYGRPRWYKDQYASNKLQYQSVTTLTGDNYASGGVMCGNKQVLLEHEGFRTDLGMRGNEVAYGEETELQIRLRRSGIEIGYIPDLLIYHLVPRYKLSVDYFFRRAYAMGQERIRSNRVKTTAWSLVAIAIAALAQALAYVLIYSPRLWVQSDYYVENWLIDVFRKPAKRISIVYHGLQQQYGDNDYSKAT